MRGSDDEFGPRRGDPLEDLLVVQPTIADEAQPLRWEHPASGVDSVLDLPILADEPLGGIGEPVGVGRGGHPRVDDRDRYRGITASQTRLAVTIRRRALVDT